MQLLDGGGAEMATICVGNSVPRTWCPGADNCRSFLSTGCRMVVVNLRMTRVGDGRKGVFLESQLSRKLLQLPRDHPFGSHGNYWRTELTRPVVKSRGTGASSRVVTEEPGVDEKKPPEGFEKWVIAAEQRFNVLATEAVVKILETLYSKRFYARFYVLETIARVPYFAFVSVLHLYETFGWWRRSDYLKIHFAESWNELHHLLVMEALGGDERWADRFLAQHIAVAYYFMTSFMYLVSPRMAYHFSECVEKHAFLTYDKFIKSHGEELKKLPAPNVAVQYYSKGDLYMFDEFQTDMLPHSRRPKIENLYDVFVNIREDEAQHCKTMQVCQTGASLRSPHEDVPLTELALKESDLAPVDCEGIFDCAIKATSFADQKRRREGGELAATKMMGATTDKSEINHLAGK